MPFRTNSSESSENNARYIKYMAALIFRKFFDLNEMPILRQAPSHLVFEL